MPSSTKPTVNHLRINRRIVFLSCLGGSELEDVAPQLVQPFMSCLGHGASLAAAMGGLDHLVFTAGIGERAAPVCQAIGQGCAWLGVDLDDDVNRRDAACISRTDSRAGSWLIPTDEERMIAWHAGRLLAPAAGSS